MRPGSKCMAASLKERHKQGEASNKKTVLKGELQVRSLHLGGLELVQTQEMSCSSQNQRGVFHNKLMELGKNQQSGMSG